MDRANPCPFPGDGAYGIGRFDILVLVGIHFRDISPLVLGDGDRHRRALGHRNRKPGPDQVAHGLIALLGIGQPKIDAVQLQLRRVVVVVIPQGDGLGSGLSVGGAAGHIQDRAEEHIFGIGMFL